MKNQIHGYIPPKCKEPLYEHYLDGGVYAPGDDDNRTDFYLKESTDNLGETIVLDLHVVNGSSDYCVVQIPVDALRRLATFFMDIAEDVEGRNRYLKDHKP